MFYDEGCGLFMGPNHDSTVGTILIYTAQRQIVRRSMLNVRFDETFVSRKKVPTLSDIFLGYQVNTFDNIFPDAYDTPNKNLIIASSFAQQRPEIPTSIAPEFFYQTVSSADFSSWLQAINEEVNACKVIIAFYL